MKQFLSTLFLFSFVFISCSNKKDTQKYPGMVEEKLKEMSLEEKIGQMTMICLSEITEGRNKKLVLDEQRLMKLIEDYHIGAFLSATGSESEWKSFTKKVQEINIQTSVSKIPILFGIDHIHGANYLDEGTIFPHNHLLACSFDTALVSKTAHVTARETAGLGVLWNFSPVLDLGKNPLWPRLYETFGEDPYVCKSMGAAYISAYQNYRTQSGHYSSSCLKHFAGYSDPRSGHDRSPAEIPDQIMYEMFLPPFGQGINAGAKSVMVNSGEVNGVPVHISHKFLTEILREKLGFKGVVITDIKDILKVVEMHRAVPSLEEAIVLAVQAGIDMSMSCNYTMFCDILVQKVNEGIISEDRIDESVLRILNMKYELGLFDDPYPEDNFSSGNTGELNSHRQIAYEAAVGSQVLLKNNGILPLSIDKNILVAGFAANSKRNLNGPWTLEWLGAEEERQPEDMMTLYDAVSNTFEGKVSFSIPGYPGFRSDFLSKSSNADVIVITVGETPYSEFKGDIDNLKINESYHEIADLAFSTDKPVILVLVEGRPRLLNGIVENSDAVIFSGFPGMMGADAIADIISGKINPSGKLAFTYPAHPANLSPYNSKITREYEPLFPFGHGLSYTEFEYSDLQLSDTLLNNNENLRVSLKVKNTGNRTGKEPVLLYTSDLFGKITRPKKELVRFLKIELEPGESKTVRFSLSPAEDLSYPDEEGNFILEKGKFKILCSGLEAGFHLNYSNAKL